MREMANQVSERHELDAPYYQADEGLMFRFWKEFLPSLPPGVGKAYLIPEQGTISEAIEIDFRTATALYQRRNCLDMRA